MSAFAFDADGRLWAATAGYGDDGTDAVYLVPSDGATPVKVIAGLHTPLGLVWSGGTLYVASAGRVDAYRDLVDGTFAGHTTVADAAGGRRRGQRPRRCHRPGGSSSGVSAPCDACVPRITRTTPPSCRSCPTAPTCGSRRGGIRAPVGLAYYPATDDLFVTMNQRDDLGDATPGDWLAVVRSGQDWGFPDCYGQGGSACDGVPTPVAELDEHAAVSGVAIVTGQLGGTVGHAALVAEWSTGTVMRVGLGPARGASPGPRRPS